MTSSMFSTRDVPWSKVGTVLDVPGITAAEAMTLAGLDFDIVKRPAAYWDDSTESYVPVAGRVALVRDDNDQFMNYATENYEPIQYRGAFDFMDEINPRYVAAGALKDGRQGFIVAELPELSDFSLHLRGQEDPHKLYVLLRTSQDLTHGIEIMLTTLRGKCMNQLTLPSLKKGSEQMWSIRHTRNVRDRLEQAQGVILQADEYVKTFEEMTAQLADIDVDFSEAQKLLTYVLPDKPQRDTQIDAIVNAFRHSKTVGFPGTGWGLVNAVDEYFEWLRPERRRTDESRFTTGLDGTAHKLTARTASLLLSR